MYKEFGIISQYMHLYQLFSFVSYMCTSFGLGIYMQQIEKKK